jgi:hypothetical protein
MTRTGCQSSKSSNDFGAAFRFYMAQEGKPFKASDFESELARRMHSRKFLKDMDGYLPKGATYDPALAHQQFLEFFLPHLDPAST